MAELDFRLLDTTLPYKVGGSVLEGMQDVNMLRSQQLGNESKQFEMQNALAEQEAYKQAAQGGVGVSQALMERGLGKQALTADKSLADVDKTKRESMKINMDLMRERTKDLIGNPSNENYIAHLQEGVRDNLITPEQAQRSLRVFLSVPVNQRVTYLTTQLGKAEDVYKANTISATDREQLNISGGNLAVARGHLALARQDQALKQAEKGPEGQVLKDIQSNTKALRTAGYNPETGEDKVSELIRKSTSGRGEAFGASLVGAAGGATSGMKAIGQLDTISKTMTLDLLNNKLGAGISNADREALEARFGSIADPNLPAEQRLAAWTEAKEIMRKAAMLPEPKGTEKSAAGKPAATKSGATVSNW